MSDAPSSEFPAGSPVRERLQQLAQELRTARHLGPRVQEELADLLNELADELAATSPSAQAEHLADTAAHLADELREQTDQGLLGAAKSRLTEAAARAEANAPVATGLARRLINALADVGI